ncbi:MAG: hypothetical protein A3B96_01895 [Candidatus Spechtbacteria bacterium RIFCSPHIGHO2_02_FULL_43_15b]|uniref:FAD/NAD(P)-binding domain-containing protein n=1 Tax=Candidatus Spechtbacteria bacterium RIFCSPHIGHO2_01_FULL_43_30 TaxID=1802158 RepID=A0A1G2H8U4_9BACT|nr:MAG: hypothetical protein A2827_02215 [Candidatus Spechtbacteria bacterium RIFCSPHIGHO2_01_FULL_43_30]OGZ60134.1 MAG: hypothetical protein A3B96_01895 [Candidatus Spechtbacteria bacterium RIFCSPHIGHO2_02_FULL_43_15b]
MEREQPSAFRPQIPEGENPSTEKEPAKKKLLQTLEQDKARVAGFDFALRAVLDGRITNKAKVTSLYKPRFGRFKIVVDGKSFIPDPTGDEYLLNSESPREPEVIGSRFVTRKELGDINLTANATSDEYILDEYILSESIYPRKQMLANASQEESRVAGFDFALRAVLDGRITEEAQLIALISPKFKSFTTTNIKYLLDEKGVPIKFGPNNFVTEGEVGNGQIYQTEFRILLNTLQEVKNASEKFELIKSRIGGLNFLLLAASTGVNSETQLRALVNPKFKAVNTNSYLIDAQGSLVRIDNSYVDKRTLERINITEEDFTLAIRLLKIFENPAIPNEIKKLKGLLLPKLSRKDRDDQAIERIELMVADLNDEQIRSEVNGFISDFTNARRNIELTGDIYTGIVEGKPTQELLQKISESEKMTDSDLKLAGELQAEVAARTKRNVIVFTTRNLRIQERNIDAAIEQVTPLLSSKNPDEKKIGTELLEQICALEIATFESEVQRMIEPNVDPEMVRIYIDGFPIRPSFRVNYASIDYIKSVTRIRERAFQLIDKILEIRRIQATTVIREKFSRNDPDSILNSIYNFPGETEADQAIRNQLLQLYKSYLATNKPEVFTSKFAEQIKLRELERVRKKFISPEKGRNREAFNFMRQRFIETVYPLVESLRSDESTASTVQSFLTSDTQNPETPNPRRQFEQRMFLLEKQRPLTDIEKSYLESVEMLSLFNPYLVACAYAEPGVTSEFLRHHFENISQNTTSNLIDGDYFPLLQIGLGPNGLAALGETVRNNPDLASAMLVVDAGKQPGGPFAIPEGPAWELNSANKRSSPNRTLPQKPGPKELQTVRAYGSPMRWYPGERGPGKAVRQGSINATVDWLITPDDISTLRYPTNEELQLVLALQAAVLTKNVALRTKVVKLEENPDPKAKGDKLVTLEITDENGTRVVKIATDAIFAATGLGESGYGFNLEGSKAEKVISQTRDMGFPKITKTLDAFNALAGRSNEQLSPPGETIAIWGKGNSADVLIEYLGSIFGGNNPRVRNITKIYVICEGDLSTRPRYSLISDLKPRNGRGNLIELVNARVSDVDFNETESEPSKRKLVFYGRDGKIIKDNSGNSLLADSAIAATGFRSQLDSIVEDYAGKKSDGKKQKLRSPVQLPTNPKVSVAETLSSDPSVLILGTASAAEFQELEKLAQLPDPAREALLRNGAENAVAIGFRAPDTQAAVNIWLNSKRVSVDKKSPTTERRKILIDGEKNVTPGETFWLELVVPARTAIPNNITDEIRLISPLFIYNVGNSIELKTSTKKGFTGELNFTLTYNLEKQMLGLKFNEENMPVSEEVIQAIKEACMDYDFQKYALTSLRKKRRNPMIDLVLSFKNGFVNPRATFAQD